MIKASELRIGNLIEFRHHTMGWSTPTQCEAWMIADAEKYPDTYRFISLTEDWLLKLGFVNEGKDSYWIQIGRQEFSVRVCQEKDWGVVYSEDVGCDMHWLCFIDHVHQLQNLIFTLTGTELTLKNI